MPRRLLAMLCILGIAACQSDRTTAGPDLPPSFVISDGANNSGNADFFILPPLASDPTGHPKFSAGQFNSALAPRVQVCLLPNTWPSDPPGPSDPGFHTCPANERTDGPPVLLVADKEHYIAEWMAPTVPKRFYRFYVSAGGKELGYADILIGHPAKDLKGYTGKVPTGAPGRTVPVKFRIENRALCRDVEGTSPCASAAVDLAEGGSVTIETDPLKPKSGVNIPAQTNGNGKINVTVEPCAGPHNGNFFARGLVDIPVFGPCLTISAEAVTLAPNNKATVFVCDLDRGSTGLSPDQEERVTLHRYDGTAVTALPHAEECRPTSAASVSTRLKGALRHLVRGEFQNAGRQLAQLVMPQPLHALDQGGGGLSDGFSDFQFALPAAMHIVAGYNQTGTVGQRLPVKPKVRVVDISGFDEVDEPDGVDGARVWFEGDGIAPVAVITSDGGYAELPAAWTIPVLGQNTLAASGRGIAGDFPNNGPRDGDDPFMAIPFLPIGESGEPGSAEPHAIGSRTFTATGTLNYSAAGYQYKLVNEGLEPNFQTAGFTGSIGGAAPFASHLDPTGTGAPQCATFYASFPPQTIVAEWLGTDSPGGAKDLLVRRTFNLKTAAALKVEVAIDNDIEIWLNGNSITNGMLEHGGCADRGDLGVFDAAGLAGVNTLAIRARDRGVISYLDVEVRFP